MLRKLKLKNKHLWLLTSLLTLFVCACMCLGGCAVEDNSSSSSSSSSQTGSITLNKESIEIDIYEQYQLTVENDTGATPVWSVQDSSVAAVTNGLVKPLKVGETTVTVTAGSASATCEVKVVEAKYVPTISVSNSNLSMDKGDELTVALTAKYNGVAIDDAFTVTWSTDDTAYVGLTPSADTKSVTVLAKEYGEATIDVSATVRGVETSASVSVKICNPAISFEIEDLEEGVNCYVLNLSARETESETDVTEYTINATVKDNNVVVENAQIQWTSNDDEVAELVAGKIVAVGVGETTVVGTYANNEVVIKVVVYRPIIALDEVFKIRSGATATLGVPETVEGSVCSVLFETTEVLISNDVGTVTIDTEKVSALYGGLQDPKLKISTEDATYVASVILVQTVGDFDVASGTATFDSGSYQATSSNTLLVKNSGFSGGTLSAAFTFTNGTAGSGTDSGLVFGLNQGNNTKFFRSDATPFYCVSFYWGGSNCLYLREVRKEFTEKTTVNLPSDFFGGNGTTVTHVLTVKWVGATIQCYVDDELLITYQDKTPLMGEGYGLYTENWRSVAGYPVVWNLTIEDEASAEITRKTVGDFNLISGEVTYENGTYSMVNGAVLMTKPEGLGDGYRYSVTIDNTTAKTEAALVFGLTEAQGEISYGISNCDTQFYGVYINAYKQIGLRKWGGRGTDNRWSASYMDGTKNGSNVYNVEGLTDAPVTLSVEWNPTTGTAKVYLNGTLMITCTDPTPLTGTGYGIFDNSGKKNATYSNVSVAPIQNN